MRRLVWPAVLVALTLVGGSARAAVVLALDLRALARSATVIADVEVVEQQSRRLSTGQIITEHVALVREGLVGVGDGEELRFFTEGGVVDGVGARVPGEPTPRVGDRVIAFLQEAGAGLRFVGMSQGCLPVDDRGAEALVLPPAAGALLVRRTPAGLVRAAPALSSPRSLTPFLQEVRALVAR